MGFYLPNLLLNHQIQSRQKKINDGLPDALDLLVVCVEAGLGLNAAMKRVAEDCKMNSPVLSQEFMMVNLEILAGLDREQALRNLAERTGAISDDFLSGEGWNGACKTLPNRLATFFNFASLPPQLQLDSIQLVLSPSHFILEQAASIWRGGEGGLRAGGN